MQMPRTVVASQQVKEAGLPYIVVFTDPTTGGVSASFAMLGDIHIAESGAQIGFAGARVIEETMRQTLPDGFQRAEFLHSHGMVDLVVHRAELKPMLVRILGLLRRPRIDLPSLSGPKGNGEAEGKGSKRAAAAVVEDSELEASVSVPAAMLDDEAAEPTEAVSGTGEADPATDPRT